MSDLPTNLDVPPIVRRKLQQVRRAVRAYVWLDGLAAVVITLAAAFWVGLLLDWLFEPGRGVRLAAIALVAALGLGVTYRRLIRRAVVPLADVSLAVLLERRFDQLRDHVLTAIDLAAAGDEPAAYHPELVSRTHRAAAMAIANVRTSELFQRRPLVQSVMTAVILAASIPLLALAAGDVFGFWLERLALSPEPWPRRVQLEVVGFPPGAGGRRTHKLAQDDDMQLVVRANTNGYVVPDVVEIRFRLEDGRRGRDTMTRVGEAVPGRDDHQLFRYDFKHVATDMTLDVVGGDDRVRDLYLQIVDRPELVRMELECVYPEYLQRPPRRLPVTGGMRIPEGTRLTLHAASTKPLSSVRVRTSLEPQSVLLGDDSARSGGSTRKAIRWDYGPLTLDEVLMIEVTDTDGITCREPYRVSLSVVPDEVPQVAVRLAGIGTSITPDATLPLVGRISDDYGLERAWFAYRVDDGTTGERPFLRQPTGELSMTELDRFDMRAADAPSGERALRLQPGQTLHLSVLASDRYDLTSAPRNGSSPQFVLDVVTVGQLLALMERRELELRQRFEAIISKMTDTRNLLSRIDFDDAPTRRSDDESSDPLEASPVRAAAESSSTPVERALSRRRLRLAGSIQNVVQSSHETLGIAEGFDDIHDQLENNRVDNTDLKNRLRENIARPLRQLGEQRMTELATQLDLVQRHVGSADAGAPALASAVTLADEILVEMQQVLERMLELESYNEVLALLRGIIHDQRQLNEQTKQRQTERLQSFFDD